MFDFSRKKFQSLWIFIFATIINFYLPLFAQFTRTMIVLDFEDKGLRRPKVELTTWIPTQIQKALVSSPYITVVERHKLTEVLKEHALSQTGIIEESTAIQVGKILGAQKIIMGEFEYGINGKYTISTRLVDIQKGTIDGQWIAAEIENKKIQAFINEVANNINTRMRNLVALENIIRLENPQPAFQLKITTTNENYRIGEMVSFMVTTDQNCYMYLFDVGTSGKIHLLFPNKLQPQNYVHASDTVRIENIKASPPAGTETVKVIATQDSISLGQIIDWVSSPATYQLFGDDLEIFARDLELMVSPLDQDRWIALTLRFEIREK